MFEREKQEILNCALMLDRYGLIALSGGNVSVRVSADKFLITPSGMIYSEMVPSDVLLVDLDGNVVEGTRKPSLDTVAISHILKNMPDVNAVIHTHQPYATGIGLVTDRLDCDLTTLANAVKGHVNVAPYTSAACLDMGIAVVDNIGSQLAVILKNHGVVTVGKDLKEALYAAVYLEESAKTIFVAKAYGGEISKFSDEQIQTGIDVFKRYGQK